MVVADCVQPRNLAARYRDGGVRRSVLGHLMNMDNERQRTIEASIERLRRRAKQLAKDDTRTIVVVGILLGILDLLEDEL